MAESKPAVKAHESLRLEVGVQAGATLPVCISAALRMARTLNCMVTFEWGKAQVTVSAEDTYQGVQRRVQRAGNAK